MTEKLGNHESSGISFYEDGADCPVSGCDGWLEPVRGGKLKCVLCGYMYGS